MIYQLSKMFKDILMLDNVDLLKAYIEEHNLTIKLDVDGTYLKEPAGTFHILREGVKISEHWTYNNSWAVGGEKVREYIRENYR